MKLNPTLVADLAALSAALRGADAPAGPEADLERSLRALVTAVARAVPSCHAVLLQVPASGASLHLAVRTATDPAPAVGASLCLPLPAAQAATPEGPRGGGVLTLYASQPGAFVDLAADLAWSLGLDPGVCVLDADLAGPGDDDQATGLAALSTIHQALGVLIGQGRTPRQAEQELHHRQRTTGSSLHQTAAAVLHSLARTPPEHQ